MESLRKTIAALTARLRALTPGCRQVARIQSAELDGPLSPAQRFGLWFHLLICKWCRRYGRQIRFLHHAVCHHPDQLMSTSQKLPDPARQRIKQRLLEEKP